MAHFKIFTGPMFGGKTTKLLGAVERDVLRGYNVQSFKPNIDTRYSATAITTHLGAKLKAFSISSGEDILEQVGASDEVVNSIAVDELFMIPGAADAVVYLFRCGINVYTSTLQLNSIPEPYKEVMKIFPWATEICVCPAICTICGADAYYTLKTGGDPGAKIEVGGSDLYEPRCFCHFF